MGVFSRWKEKRIYDLNSRTTRLWRRAYHRELELDQLIDHSYIYLPGPTLIQDTLDACARVRELVRGKVTFFDMDRASDILTSMERRWKFEDRRARAECQSDTQREAITAINRARKNRYDDPDGAYSELEKVLNDLYPGHETAIANAVRRDRYCVADFW